MWSIFTWQNFCQNWWWNRKFCLALLDLVIFDHYQLRTWIYVNLRLTLMVLFHWTHWMTTVQMVSPRMLSLLVCGTPLAPCQTKEKSFTEFWAVVNSVVLITTMPEPSYQQVIALLAVIQPSSHSKISKIQWTQVRFRKEIVLVHGPWIMGHGRFKPIRIERAFWKR